MIKKKFYKLSPSIKAEKIATRANNCDDEVNYKYAIMEISKALEVNDECETTYFIRGDLYSEMDGYHDQAISDYTRAIELDPNDFAKYNARGRAYLKAEKYENAINDFTKVIEMSMSTLLMDSSSVFEERGFAFLKCGFFGKAISDFSESLKDSEDEIKFLCRAMALAKNDNYDGALNDLIAASNINGNCLKENKNFLSDFPKDFKAILFIHFPKKYLDDLNLSI